jgi:hypothetical protein
MKIIVLTVFLQVAPTIAVGGSSFKGTVTDSSDTPISATMVLIHWDSAGSAVGLVQRLVGQALYAAQCGEEVVSVKGFGGRGVLEIAAPHDENAYRAVYTIRFHDAVYVLHAFQRKAELR